MLRQGSLVVLPEGKDFTIPFVLQKDTALSLTGIEGNSNNCFCQNSSSLPCPKPPTSELNINSFPITRYRNETFFQ